MEGSEGKGQSGRVRGKGTERKDQRRKEKRDS